jgi:hypothetical protein
MANRIPETAAQRESAQHDHEMAELKRAAELEREREQESRGELVSGAAFRASPGTEEELRATGAPPGRSASTERNLSKMVRGLSASDYLRKAANSPTATRELADAAHRREQYLYMVATNPRAAQIYAQYHIGAAR